MHFSDVLRQSSDVRLWELNRPKLAAPEGRLLTPTPDIAMAEDAMREYLPGTVFPVGDEHVAT